MWKHAQLDPIESVAVVKLNRPAKHNSVSTEMLLELIQCAEYLKSNIGIRPVITTANGPSLCPGMDLKSILSGGK